MNLQIDLLLENEHRSGSSVRGRFLLVLAGTTGPAVLLLMLAGLLWSRQAARVERDHAEEEKRRLEPEYRRVVQLSKELKEAETLLGALDAWRTSRLDSRELIRGLQRITPATIQYLQWTMDERLAPTPAGFGRTASMFLKGKVAGARPEADVQQVTRALREDAFFAAGIEAAIVRKFAASEAPGEADQRVFEIEARFRPRVLGPPAPAAPAEAVPRDGGGT